MSVVMAANVVGGVGFGTLSLHDTSIQVTRL
jgi:hypothetical protein